MEQEGTLSKELRVFVSRSRHKGSVGLNRVRPLEFSKAKQRRC